MMTKQEDPSKLTKSQEFDNYMMALGLPFVWLACIQWTLTTWYAQWRNCQRKRKPFRPQMPNKITTLVTSGVPAADSLLLRQWGISNQMTAFWWIDRNTIERNILVSAQQFDFADAILHQDGAVIVSKAGGKRGAHFTTPWGVGAKARSFDERINHMIGDFLGEKHHGVSNGHKRAKLGKTYR
jgi:hypothetical protein